MTVHENDELIRLIEEFLRWLREREQRKRIDPHNQLEPFDERAWEDAWDRRN